MGITKERGYQSDFSANNEYVFDLENRKRKAETMLAVLAQQTDTLENAKVLNVGGGAGAIDFCLSPSVGAVFSMDIDIRSVTYGKKYFRRENLHYTIADGMNLPFPDGSFDIVVCSHVYEHVPVALNLMREILRVLNASGFCYFAAGNRIQVMEPHYNLPFLSVLPGPLANQYMRLTGKGDEYYEKHLTLGGLRALVSDFELIDYTGIMISDPKFHKMEYLIGQDSLKQKIAGFLFTRFKWIFPSFVWILKKPNSITTST